MRELQLASPACLKSIFLKISDPLIFIPLPWPRQGCDFQYARNLARRGRRRVPALFAAASDDVRLGAQRYERVRSAHVHLVALLPRIDRLIAELTDKDASTTGGVQEDSCDALVAILTRVCAMVSTPALFGWKTPFVVSLSQVTTSVCV